MCAYIHLPLPYAHSVTNGYLLVCQCPYPVTWINYHYDFFTKLAQAKFVVLMQLFANIANIASYTSVKVVKATQTFVCNKWGGLTIDGKFGLFEAADGCGRTFGHFYGS